MAHASNCFHEAALGLTEWSKAADAFADAVNTRSGQLIGLGRDDLVSLNIMGRMDEDAGRQFALAKGGSPLVNSRVRVGMSRGELEFADESDFTTAADSTLHPEFGAWLARHDIGYTCTTNLIRQPGLVVGMAALRSRSQGEMLSEEKRAFMALAGHARAAVRLRLALDDQAFAVLTTGLDGVNVAAVICDPSGKIRAMSKSAQELASRQSHFRIVDGKLHPHHQDDRKALARGLSDLAKACSFAADVPAHPVVLRAPEALPLTVELHPLPTAYGSLFSPSFMLVLRGFSMEGARRAASAARMWGLTATEERIACLVLDGQSVSRIADICGITIGTTRIHLHRINAKAGVSSKAEFIALMTRF